MKYIQLDGPMEKLYKLQLSDNELKSIDLSQFPGLRTLYLDDNNMHHIIGRVSRIESLSLRDQQYIGEYSLHCLRGGARKLYLSGSPFQQRLVDFFSLEYLELCAASIENLPVDFGLQVPNLSTLYLSFNRITNLEPLITLKYLKRLVLIENRLIQVQQVLNILPFLKRLRYLDLR